ncbi:alpha/beta hydrolase [Neobacillus mesonae]|uniref:alpha/beta hydrolase n=1 Tax=Neobacillus mesonae TaxID=1193713 RepID=UPI00203DF80F|nr:alpha/beta hydrolase [Neobacillus mesonae]MCM3570698.1 alpha/beta hydrolase [Neobacillus mesonae]
MKYIKMGFFRFIMLLSILLITILSGHPQALGKEFKQMNLSYGDGSKQKLDIYSPHIESGRVYPVIVYVHGGGWMRGDKSNVAGKPSFFTNKGYVFVSVNYRLSPKVPYTQMAQDVSSAVKWVYDHAEQYHIDKTRINLMGHSAGGHLVTLITTNPNFLNQAGLSQAAVKSVVNLDGPIDLEEFIPRNKKYKPVFGYNRQGWAAASPITYSNQQHLPPVLLVGPKKNSTAKYVTMAEKAGNIVQTFTSKTLTHREITKLLGAKSNSEEAINMTKSVSAFLEAIN